MQWCSWKWWRLARSSWEKGSKPTSCTDGSGRWIPLALGIWWLANQRAIGRSETLTVTSSIGLEVGDAIVLNNGGDRWHELVYALTETTITVRPNTPLWRSLIWIRQRWRRLMA